MAQMLVSFECVAIVAHIVVEETHVFHWKSRI